MSNARLRKIYNRIGAKWSRRTMVLFPGRSAICLAKEESSAAVENHPQGPIPDLYQRLWELVSMLDQMNKDLSPTKVDTVLAEVVR